jgi:hypothetical protein
MDDSLILPTSCWAVGCSRDTPSARPGKYPPRYHFGNLDSVCRRAQNSDYACDPTRNRCQQKPLVIGRESARYRLRSSPIVCHVTSLLRSYGLRLAG